MSGWNESLELDWLEGRGREGREGRRKEGLTHSHYLVL